MRFITQRILPFQIQWLTGIEILKKSISKNQSKDIDPWSIQPNLLHSGNQIT